MQRAKSQLNAIYYSYRDRAERRRNARKALYGWLKPGDLSESAALWLEHAIEDGCAGEFVSTCNGYRENRRPINWKAVSGRLPWTWHYAEFERYRAAVRAQKSRYYRRRLAKLGIDWRHVQKPYETGAIEID